MLQERAEDVAIERRECPARVNIKTKDGADRPASLGSQERRQQMIGGNGNAGSRSAFQEATS